MRRRRGGLSRGPQIAVREYVEATAAGESTAVDDVEVTMAHFERALEAVGSDLGGDDSDLEGTFEAA